MKFPNHVRHAKGEDLSMGLLTWRSAAITKRDKIHESVTWLYNEDRPLYDLLEQELEDLEWIFIQIANRYRQAWDSCSKIKGKLDGSGNAEATETDILAAMDMIGHTQAVSELVSLSISQFSELISPKLNKYPAIREDIDQQLIWD